MVGLELVGVQCGYREFSFIDPGATGMGSPITEVGSIFFWEEGRGAWIPVFCKNLILD